jgi:hypothetical protein
MEVRLRVGEQKEETEEISLASRSGCPCVDDTWGIDAI